MKRGWDGTMNGAMNGGGGNRTVLIVEDAETCAATLEIAFLAIPKLIVIPVSTAGQALKVLQDGQVSALVTDLNMPRMDGFELIARIRADGRWFKLPVIVVSGDTDPRTPERVARLGVDAYFSKPYSPAEVREKLEHLLNANPTPDVP